MWFGERRTKALPCRHLTEEAGDGHRRRSTVLRDAGFGVRLLEY